MKTLMNQMGLALFLMGATAFAESVLFELHVPSENAQVFIEGQPVASYGLVRLFKSDVPKVASYRHTFLVRQGTTDVTRVVSFTGSEERIVVRILAEEFQGAQLVALVKGAEGGYRAADPNRLANAQAGLRQALAALDPMIARSSSAPYWRQRLSWPVLEQQVSAAAPDAMALDRAYRTLFANEEGLEYAQVIDVKNALKELKDAAYFATLKNGAEVYQGHLNDLMARLPRYESQQESADRLAIGEAVGFLEAGRFAPEVVSAIHGRYSRTNSVLQVHSRLFTSLVNKSISQSQPVNQLILGNPTVGWSHVEGQAYLRLIPSEPGAQIEVGMVGTMTSDSTSYGGERGVSVQVASHTVNNVQVSRLVTLNDLTPGAASIGPARATVTPVGELSSSQIGVQAQAILPIMRRIKSNIGYRTAVERMPAGQAEGRRIAANELAAAANNQNVQAPEGMKKLAEDFGALFKEFYQLPQQRTGVAPRTHWMATDTEWLYSKHIRRLDHELAAPLASPPTFQSAELDFGYRMHESELTNTANRQISGSELADTDLQALCRNVFNYVPRPLRVGTHVARWSSQLAKDHPVALDFDDGSLRLALRIQSLHQDAFRDLPAKDWNTPFEVRVTYQPALSGSGIKLDRVGEVVLVPQVVGAELKDDLRSLMQAKFSALFGETLYPDGLTPVSGGMFEAMTSLKIREFRTEGGWLLVGLKFEGDISELIKKGTLKDPGDDRTKRPTK